MKTEYPALALLEYAGAAHGLHAVDAMIKKAPIALLKCGTVHPGRFLALLGGTMASTEEAYHEGVSRPGLHDSVLLPDAHAELQAALLGRILKPGDDALGVMETVDSCAMLKVADAAVKSAPIEIIEMRLADDLHGRSLLLLSGTLPDVDAAMDAGAARLGDPAQLTARTLIPRLDGNLADLLAGGTEFRLCDQHRPEGAEQMEDAHVSG
jgi:bacterial microcompartment shell protein